MDAGTSMKDKIKYFNALAHRWDESVGNDEERHGVLDKVFDSMRLRPGDSVLDAGCGNGVLFRHIETRIGEGGSITALDIAPAMIERARKLHGDLKNIRYHVGDIADAPFREGEFDAVLCFAVIPHVDDIAGFLLHLRRIIKPDGVLYIFHLADTKRLNDFHSGLDAPVRHDMLPYRDELQSLLNGAGFSMTEYIDMPGLNFVESRPC